VFGMFVEVFDVFEVDYDYFIEGDVFIFDLIVMWVEWKCKNEVDLIWLCLYLYEFELYFDI